MASSKEEKPINKAALFFACVTEFNGNPIQASQLALYNMVIINGQHHHHISTHTHKHTFSANKL